MAREHDRQRKLQRKAKKASKRRERTRRNSKTPLSPGAACGLDEADELLAEGEYRQAIDVLEELRRRYPSRPEILTCLADAYLRTGDRWAYQETCARLAAADPTEPMTWVVLGSAAIGNAQPAAAHRAFTHATINWPNRKPFDAKRRRARAVD